jgi:thymidylate synthase ThyX
MDRMFDTYADLLPQVQAHLSRRFPRQSADSDFVYRQSIRAKALDALRGLLPAASLSNVGIYGTGQSYEMLLLRMRLHPLPEARRYADMILTELRKVIPSFLQRVDAPERGDAWARYLADTRWQTDELVGRLWPDRYEEPVHGPEVRLTDFDPGGEEEVLVGACFSVTGLHEQQLRDRVRALDGETRAALLKAYVGDRTNRRHRPGRALERTGYRFEVVSDYGAFRDLQRHRMMTIDWQPLGTNLGYEIPEVVIEAGGAAAYESSMARSAELYEALGVISAEQASYAVALGFRIRYVMQMNAREAMHVIELRSGQQGHPSYRRIAQQMHRLIAEEAGHGALAASMSFVDHDTYDLERIEAERRAEARRVAGAGVGGSIG